MTSHGNNATSSLRPRNRRLISISDDESGLTIDLASGPRTAPIVGSTPEQYGARTSSTAVSAPLRAQPNRSQTTGSSRKWGLAVPTPTSASFLFSPKAWVDSLSSLQDVGRTFLGSDLRDLPRSASLSKAKHGRQGSRYGGTMEDEWGPTIRVEDSLAAGSQEDRTAQIQARKRQALLMANGYTQHNSRGHFKRKSSVDETPVAHEDNQDALVYVHSVQPTDTVMGIAIKYGCSEAVVRRTNRLWANDSMQLKRLAYIPVNACTIRGQKIDEPNRTASVVQRGAGDTPLTPRPEDDWSIPTTPKAPTYQSSMPSPTMSSTTASYEIASPHIHESWVQIAGFPTSTEIARLPRKSLGFFPPPRRKSNSYHDSTPSSANSPVIPASESPPGIRRSTVPALNLPPSTRHVRPRALSQVPSSPNTVASVLRGPGGVGTLGYEARAPGPAEDGLNAFVLKHFPQAAISPTSFPYTASNFDSLHSGISTPTGSVSGGLEQISGKVEGWIRKSAKGVRNLNGSSGTGIHGSRRGSISLLVDQEVQGDGDLIELMDGMDLLDEDSMPNNDKGKAPASHPQATVSSRDTQGEDALRDRFGVGGRVFDSIAK